MAEIIKAKIKDLPSIQTSENTDVLVVEDKDGVQTSKITRENLLKEVVQAVQDVASDVTELESTKQDNLVSGQNIKTVNGQSILGSGNIILDTGKVDDVLVNGVSVVQDKNANIDLTPYASKTYVDDEDQKLKDKIADIELAKFPNVTIIGQPTIQQGQISNFSSTNYCQFPFVVDFQNQPFKLDFEITTGNEVTQQHNVFDSVFGLAFAVRQSKFVLAVSTNGTSWNIGEVLGSHIVLPNTTYRIRLVWDRQNLTLEYSTDGGSSYIVDSTRALTEQPYPKQMFIGITSDKSTTFNGIINLNYASLEIANKVVWQGMDDVGLATRMAVDMSNIDEAGINKVKTIYQQNETPYQVNGDYNPAHKKYVDEQDTKKQDKLTAGEHILIENNVISAVFEYPVYGIKRSLATTSTIWIRTDDSIGLVANATKDGSSVQNDFDDLFPWNAIKTVNILNDKVVAEIGDANFKFDGSNGEVMTYIPSFYLKRWQDENNEYMQISKFPFEGAFKVEEFYIGRYTTSSRTHSMSGVTSQVSQNITTFRNQAKAKGNGWSQLDWRYFIIQYLYLVEYANANSQSMLGGGNVGTSAQITLGGCDSLGMKSGCLVNDNAHAVIYRGIENPFGNIWQFVDGINIKDWQAYICYEPSQYVVDKFVEPYQALGYVNANANGQANKMGYDANNQLVALTSAVGTSTYGDYYYQNSGNRIVFVGGAWYGGSYAGFFFWYCDAGSGVTGSDIGARLLKTSV
mgnify:CR=1 FL=1